VLTDGGRVLGVTALGDTLADAKRRAYEAVARIDFPEMHYRRDIADKALRRLEKESETAGSAPPS
jgi:phosphoribosylamine--glycine ligase